jgi:hypothetical protein
MCAVRIICHSPALTGLWPANAADKRILFCQSAICESKKDFLSIYSWKFAMIRCLPRRSENQNIYPLAERAARCSNPEQV